MPAYSKRVRQIVRQSSYFTRVSALYVRNKLDTKVFNFKRHLHLPVCRRCCMLDCTVEYLASVKNIPTMKRLMKNAFHSSMFLLLTIFILSNKIFANNIFKPQSDTMATGKYANVNGIKMYYEIHGEGKPLVLIHGGGSTIQTTFGRILPLFAEHYKVIAVELQAHGHTSDRNAPETFEQDADDVATLLKQINIPKTSVLGFSNGGTTAMQIAIRHPEVVNKLVIIAAAYQREGFIPGFFEGMQHASLENMPQPLKDAFS